MPHSDKHALAAPDDGNRAGIGGSNSYQVWGLSRGSNEGKGEGVKSQGWHRGSSNRTQESVTHRFWPFHLCTSSHSAGSQWQLRTGVGVADRRGFPHSELSMCFKALGHQSINRLWHFTAHLRRLHIFVWDCFYNSHCGSLSPTLVAYAGGGSLSSSQWICCSTDRGLWGRRWGWWESIL